jgi:alpha-tubulin suppressor-like RCC1 family protein
MIYSLLNTLLLFMFVSCIPSQNSFEQATGEKPPVDITYSVVSISPTFRNVAPNETVQFAGAGGRPPYSFSIVAGAGSINSSGLFTASNSTTGSVTVKISDEDNNSAFATLSVGSELIISPSMANLNTNATFQFGATGGIAPYTYSVIGEGSINSTTGLYTASAMSGNATVVVTDSQGISKYASVAVNISMTLSHPTLLMQINKSHSFSTSGGVTPYTYTVYTGEGTIHPTTGHFIASANAGTTIIRVTDAQGSIAEGIITVVTGPQIYSEKNKVPINSTLSLTSLSGVAPFVFSKLSGGGIINSSTGVFTSASDASITVVRVTDNNGHASDKTIETFIPSKVAIGESSLCYTKYPTVSSSQTKCFGRKLNGRLLSGDFYTGENEETMGNNLSDVEFKFDNAVLKVFSNKNSENYCALFNNWQVICWGSNSLGQLGIGSTSAYGLTEASSIKQLGFIKLGTGISIDQTLDPQKAISLGGRHICFITSGGQLKCQGYNNFGQLGIGSTANRGTVVAHTGDGMMTANLGTGRSAKMVAAGYDHTCVILDNNLLKCFGYGVQGQLGQGGTGSLGISAATIGDNLATVDLGTGRTVKYIAAGYYHNCAILDNDQVKCWGYGSHGQAGVGGTFHRGDNANEMGDNLPAIIFKDGKTPIKLVAGIYHTCALMNDGSAVCWGYNAFGELGVGNTTNYGSVATHVQNLNYIDVGTGRSIQDITANHYSTCALLDDNSIKCWGIGSSGQLGRSVNDYTNAGDAANEMGDYLLPVNLGTGVVATDVAIGIVGCAVTGANKIKCWGNNLYGTRGDNNKSLGDIPEETGNNVNAIDLGSSAVVKDISSFAAHSCALLTNGDVKCWGLGSSGQLFQGHTLDLGDHHTEKGDSLPIALIGTNQKAKEVSVGFAFSCALREDDTVVCVGINTAGQLGINSVAQRGHTVATVGDNLLVANMGAGKIPKEIKTGHQHACVLLSNNLVKCWGLNANGQLGMGDTVNKLDPSVLPELDFGTGRTVKQLVAGSSHNCVILDNDQVKCWGYGNFGNLGHGAITNLGNLAGQMGDNLPSVDLGSNFMAKKLAAGYHHNCALSTAGKVKCWGHNLNGQLGIKHTLHMGDNFGEMGDNLPEVDLGSNRIALDIFAGHYNSCAVLDDGDIKCWGLNTWGELGLGHQFNMGLDHFSMGDNLPAVNLSN